MKYPAMCGTDFMRKENSILVLKTFEDWIKYANKEANRKSKSEKFLWKPSVFLNDDKSIHGRTFDYVTISYYHQY